MERNHWYHSIFCLLLWAQTLELSFGKQISKTSIRVVRVETACPSHAAANGSKWVFHYFNITQTSAHKQAFDIKFEFIKPPAYPKKGKMSMLRCETQNFESCVEVVAFKTDVCEMSRSKGLFKMYFDMIKPKLTCPLKSGVHELRNLSIDVNGILGVIPPGLPGLYENYFDVRIRFPGQNDVEFLCVDGLLKFDQIRKRNG